MNDYEKTIVKRLGPNHTQCVRIGGTDGEGILKCTLQGCYTFKKRVYIITEEGSDLPFEELTEYNQSSIAMTIESGFFMVDPTI